MRADLLCPTDGVKINETKVRLVAGFVLITTLLYWYTGWLILPVLLLIDFALRSFDFGKYSPLGKLAEWVIKVTQLPYKPTDQAPKRFAARIGLGFSLLLVSLPLIGLATNFLIGTLAVFATLESVLGFCAGCYVYTFYVRLFPKAI